MPRERDRAGRRIRRTHHVAVPSSLSLGLETPAGCYDTLEKRPHQCTVLFLRYKEAKMTCRDEMV